MRSVETFTTRRLAAARVRFPDYPEWIELFRNPGITAKEGGPWPIARIARGFSRQLQRWERSGIGYWVFRDRSEGRLVGIAGLRDVPRAGPLEIELGYALMPGFWGKGLATEMARGVLDAGVEDLGSRTVIASTRLTHAASRRVLEKIGFKFEAERRQDGTPQALYRWRP